MGNPAKVPFVLISTTFVGSATPQQKNLRIADQAVAVRDAIPPRLQKSLRGTIEWVSAHAATGTGQATIVSWYANDSFLLTTAPITKIRPLGVQTVDMTTEQGSTGVSWGEAQSLNIFHEDEDSTGEFHVRYDGNVAMNNVSVVVTFAYLPEFSIGR